MGNHRVDAAPPMSAGFFIAGTGTGVGKTLVTEILCHQLRAEQRDVLALKPVITGFDAKDPNNDTARLLRACGLEVSEQNIQRISPWRFVAPISPDMAAAQEGKTITLSEVVAFCRHAGEVVVESAGGILSPLCAEASMCDLAKALGLPVILVAGSYLGTISHTLSALQVLKTAGLEVIEVIVSESEQSPVPLAQTIESLKRFSEARIIALPRLEDSAQMWQNAPNLIPAT